jgi:NTP pyrophosphatase (non-canonical NTP hydrolase)
MFSFSFDSMKDWDKLTDLLLQFREERNWAQFHNTKDLALAISIEASELNELFLWKQAKEADRDKLKEEVADILSFLLLLAHEEKLDLDQIVKDKIAKNALKYPVDKAKGNAKKYTDL